jgi:hypothetical protein
MRNISDKSYKEKKKQILCSISFPENCTVYEIMWENTVEQEQPQMRI